MIFSHALRVDMFLVSKKTVRFEHREAIKYLQLKGMTLSPILETLQGTSGEDACYIPQTNVGSVN